MKKNWRYHPARWLLALLILLFLFLALSRFDLRSLLHSVKQIPLWSIAMLLGLQIVSQLLVNFQWYKIAKFCGAPLSFRIMFYINCQGAVMDSITPGVKIGGEITRSVQISRIAACSGEQAAAVTAMQKVFSMSAFFLINVFAAGYIIGKAPFPETRHLQFFMYGIAVLFLLLLLCLFFMPRRMKTYLQIKAEPRSLWLLRLRGFSLVLLDQIISIRKNTKTCAALFLLSNLIWLLYPVKLYLLAVQFFPEVNIVLAGVVTFVSYMVAMLPVFPGGLGGFEGTMTGLLLAMGFLRSDALVITVIFRFATFWFVLLVSLVFSASYKIITRLLPAQLSPAG